MIRKLSLVALLALAAAPAMAEGVAIAVPARDIARGEIIARSDVTEASMPAAAVMVGTVLAAADAEGMEARRVLHAGEAIRASDLRRPVLVSKGSTVTMRFEAPGILLTVAGKAMSEGGMGENVTIQNPASFRQIAAVVTGPGTVRAANSTVPSPRLAAR